MEGQHKLACCLITHPFSAAFLSLRSRLRRGLSSAAASLLVRLPRGFSAASSAPAAGSWSDLHEEGFLPDLGVLPALGVPPLGLRGPGSETCF